MAALFDENGYPVKEAFDQLREEQNKEDRDKFFSVYAPEIRDRGTSYWKFPYTEVSPSLLEYERSQFSYLPTFLAGKVVTTETWNAFRGAYENVPEHFERVLASIEDGTFTDDEGNKPVKVEDGKIDVSLIAHALAREGYGKLEIFGFISTSSDDIEDSDKYTLSKGEMKFFQNSVTDNDLLNPDALEEGYCLIFNDKDPDLGVVKHTMPYTEYGMFIHYPFMYLTLYALVSLMNCGKSVRALAYPMKRERAKKNMKTDSVKMPNDAVHKALLDRPKDTAIEAYQYFDPEAKAIEIPTGGGGYATVTIINDMPFDAMTEAYRLSPVDRFWYEAVCSMAYEGMGVIRGSQLMTFNGWKNPYQENARKTMERALNSIAKMSRIRVGIDTTNEKKKRYRKLAESYGFRPVIDCNYDIMRFDDGTLDFEITLNTTNDGTPFGALPLAVYARDKKQLVSASREEMEFRTIKHLETDQRMMWRYVMRRMREQKTSNTIVFDTIFRNIGLENIDRFKRARMLSMLHKMLEERQEDGILTFTWNRDRLGKNEYSVTIRPIAKMVER